MRSSRATEHKIKPKKVDYGSLKARIMNEKFGLYSYPLLHMTISLALRFHFVLDSNCLVLDFYPHYFWLGAIRDL